MSSKFDLQDQVVVITGGLGLLGRALLAGIEEAGGRAVSADLRQADDLGHDQVIMDITSKESIERAIEEVRARHGRIDALVNSAYPRNRQYGRSFFDVEYTDFCENLSLHLGGYFLTSQQFAAFFKQQGRGNIVLISSIYGMIAPKFEIYDGTPMTMPVEYAAIKAGVAHLARYMAKYLKGTGVRVNVLSPGGIEDGQSERFLAQYWEQTLGRGMLTSEDLVGPLIFLLSEAASMVNGYNLVVDDGFTL
jgi:NAD(P)-dependent dehydrogenase (short-subunit alcohol dehydrogenase family)